MRSQECQPAHLLSIHIHVVTSTPPSITLHLFWAVDLQTLPATTRFSSNKNDPNPVLGVSDLQINAWRTTLMLLSPQAASATVCQPSRLGRTPTERGRLPLILSSWRKHSNNLVQPLAKMWLIGCKSFCRMQDIYIHIYIKYIRIYRYSPAGQRPCQVKNSLSDP